MAWREALVAIAKGLVRSGNWSTGLERNKGFSCLKAFCWGFSQVQHESFLVRLMSGLAIEE